MSDWQTIDTITYPHVDAKKIEHSPNCPPLHSSDRVLLSDGKRRWIGRDEKMDSKRIDWAGKLATHWMPLPPLPKTSVGESTEKGEK